MKNVRNIVNVIIVMMICFVGYGQNVNYNEIKIVDLSENKTTLFGYKDKNDEGVREIDTIISDQNNITSFDDILDLLKKDSIIMKDLYFGTFDSYEVNDTNYVIKFIHEYGTIEYDFEGLEISEGHIVSTNDEQLINFNVYPNPVVNVLNIDVEQNTTVEIYNMNGQMIYADEVNSMTTNQIDVSDYDSGIYIVKIGNATKKIVK